MSLAESTSTKPVTKSIVAPIKICRTRPTMRSVGEMEDSCSNSSRGWFCTNCQNLYSPYAADTNSEITEAKLAVYNTRSAPPATTGAGMREAA